MSRPTDAPLISIVLPTYNGQRHLAQSIDSCLAQTLTDWELIVVDDASTDATPAMLADYAARDSRIRVVRNEVNLRLPRSLNHGFSLARGALYTWTSDDNRYLPEALAQLTKCLTDRPDAAIAVSDYTLIDENGHELPPWSRRGNVGRLEDLPLGNAIGASFLYRREVQEALGGYAADLFLVEDYDFWLRASTRFTFAFLSESLYQYRHHSGSLTQRRAGEISRAIEACIARNLPHLGWMSAATRVRAYRSLIDRAVGRGDRAAAARHVWLAVTRGSIRMSQLERHRMAATFAPRVLLDWHLGRRLQGYAREVFALLPADRHVLLVDNGQWDATQFRADGRSAAALPSRTSAAPTDESTIAQARAEIRRLQMQGNLAVVLGAPALWWMESDSEFARLLIGSGRCVLETESLRVYDLADSVADSAPAA